MNKNISSAAKRYFLIILFGSVCCLAKSQALAEDYSNLKNWLFDSNVFRLTYEDLPDVKSWDIRYIDIRTGIWWNKQNEPESFSMTGCTLLPKDSISISLNLKSYRLDSLTLMLYFYGKHENLIDSTIYPLDVDGMNNIRFNNERAELMQMKIFGFISEKIDSVSLQIRGLNIRSKGIELKQWEQTPDTASIDIRRITPLPVIDRLDEFRNRKIIGLAESFHGGEQINIAIYDVIRNILPHNVRLICFEIPVDMGMNWDLYVQGILPQEYRYKILDELRMTTGDARLLTELLDEIRALNITRKEGEKVHVVGLDFRSEKYYLFEYLKAYKDISKDRKSFEKFMLENFAKLDYHENNISKILDAKTGISVDRRHSAWAERLKSEKKLQKLMGANDYKFLMETLAANIPTSRDVENDLNGLIIEKHDSMMWKILEVAIACYAPEQNDRVVINAHTMHLSKTYNEHSFFPLLSKKNLGCYIAEHYSDDFWTTSFHAGRGFRKSVNFKRIEALSLQTAFPGSFESAANKTALSNFYCKSDDLEDIFVFRMIPQSKTDLHFYPMSRNRFDGYAFINKTEACNTDQFDLSTSTKREAEMNHYFDSLRIPLVTGSNKFDLDLDPAIVIVPKGFKWKTTSIYPGGRGLAHGFFESDDRECVITFGVNLYDPKEQFISTLPENLRRDPYSGDILKKAKDDLLKEMKMKVVDKLFMRSFGVHVEKPNEQNLQNFDFLLEELGLMHVWSSNDAYAVFNADKVIEYEFKKGWSPYGYFSKYRYGETISAEKNGRMVILICRYTENGYKNRLKYRKSIESIFKFK